MPPRIRALKVQPKPKADDEAQRRDSVRQQLESKFSDFDQLFPTTGFRESEVMGLSGIMGLETDEIERIRKEEGRTILLSVNPRPSSRYRYTRGSVHRWVSQSTSGSRTQAWLSARCESHSDVATKPADVTMPSGSSPTLRAPWNSSAR